MWDTLWMNATVATMEDGAAPFGLIDNGAVGIADGRIAWVGQAASLPDRPLSLAREVLDARARVLTPGLCDPHTHVVYAGHRRGDFELRIAGATRDDLAKVGGGVRGNVFSTRAASDAQLMAETLPRVAALIAGGVTTLESKSGFGLDLETELRQMRIAREIPRRMPLDVVSTYLGLHGLPPEYDGRADDWVGFCCDTVLPRAVAEGLVDFVDGYCDSPAFRGFSHDQTSRMFEAGKAHGLHLTLHADQYSDFDVGGLAARHGALSAAHLEYSNEASAEAMAKAGTVALLLPGANYTLFETQKPPVGLFRRHGVRMALATNCNASSSPCTMPTMIMNMGCHMFRMTPEEAVAGFTREAARALGLLESRGTLTAGKRADMVLWDIDHPAELPYRLAHNPVQLVIRGGSVVYRPAPPELLAPG